MTREEYVDWLCRLRADLNNGVIFTPWNKEFTEALTGILEQESIAQERYEDLCEYFGGVEDILKNRDDFKAWLGRVKWHIHKAEELYEKYEQKYCDRNICVSNEYNGISCDECEVTKSQEPKTGHWIIYDVHGHKACKCSECGMDVGYPCNDKYCPKCGAKMVEPQESEGEE